MSIWSRVANFISKLAKRGHGPWESAVKPRRIPDRQVLFTISIIGLGAKLAKADGRVTVDEIRAFREIFTIPEADEKHVARVFNYAKQQTEGYEFYAAGVAKAFGKGNRVLADVMEGLFNIASSDGALTEAEVEFLYRVNGIFGLSEENFRCRLARFTEDKKNDPYKILGVDHEAETEDIRKRWRMLVRRNHPDALVARGVPDEAIRIAETRLSSYNDAWDRIQKLRRQRKHVELTA